MSKILVVTWDGGGNVPPALGIAAELKARGHDIRVMGHPVQSQQVAAYGLDFIEYTTARRFQATDDVNVLGYIELFGDRAMGRDVAAELRRQPADLVIVDCLLFGPMEAVFRNGTPYVVLEHFYDGYFTKRWLRSPLGWAMTLKRFRPHLLLDRAALRLVATLPELDPGTTGRQAAQLKYAGPAVTGSPAHPAEPTVLVSLSTFNFPGQTRAMQNILDALATLEVRAIVTTGPVISANNLTPPPNAEMHEFVPHADLMPHVSLVVGHGGHATTMQALAHDLPLVVMPQHPMLDQKMIGTSVEAAGAGLVLSKNAKPAQITDAMRRLLADGPHRQAAARLGRAIRQSQGTQRGADLIEQIVSPASATRF